MTGVKDGTDQENQMNLQSTYEALLFGVPTQGLRPVSLVSLVENGSARYTLDRPGKKHGHMWRSEQHGSFCKALDSKDSKIIRFHELEKSPVMVKVYENGSSGKYELEPHGTPEVLVSAQPVALGWGWETGRDCEKPMDENHMTLVKFPESDNGSHKAVRDVLRDSRQLAPSTILTRMKSSLCKR